MVALRNIKRDKVTLLADVRHTKMSLFKLPITLNLRQMSNQDTEFKLPRVHGISNLVVKLSSQLDCNVIGRATEGLIINYQ